MVFKKTGIIKLVGTEEISKSLSHSVLDTVYAYHDMTNPLLEVAHRPLSFPENKGVKKRDVI